MKHNCRCFFGVSCCMLIFILIFSSCKKTSQSDNSQATNVPNNVSNSENIETLENSKNIYRPLSDINLEEITKSLDESCYKKYNYHLFENENTWSDSGVRIDEYSKKNLHEYVYRRDASAYLEPGIICEIDQDTGKISSVYIMQSQEHISETTQNVYKKYFMSLAESLFVEVNEEKLEVLFSKLTASEYLLNKIEKPHSDTIYYFNEICCYSYFMAGSSKIRFETLTNEQKDEYHLNGISCIDINNMD